MIKIPHGIVPSSSGEAIVFGGLIALMVLRALVCAVFGLTGDHYIFIFYLFLPYLLPAVIELFILDQIFHINGCAAMAYIPPVFASLVLWWIFLGVVLATIIYRIRLSLQRKDGREIETN
ncbi:MAG: hypothetical protein FWC43_03635 [Planctomycetaceae bacterium]|nr:hypothetical protein [Planctomycetaceae bacterium]